MSKKTLAWAGGTAAVATAIVAWLTFYFTFFQPKTAFDAKVTFGSPVLKDFHGQVSVVLSILVSNAGGRAGGIGDMGLRLQSKATKTRWALVPVSFVDMESYLRVAAEKQDISSSITAPFSSIVLAGNASGRYTILFLSRPVKVPPLGPLRMEDLVKDDTYQLELQIVTTAEDGVVSTTGQWNTAARFEFVVKQEHLDGLKGGLAIIPLDTVRDSLRDKFLEQ